MLFFLIQKSVVITTGSTYSQAVYHLVGGFQGFNINLDDILGGFFSNIFEVGGDVQLKVKAMTSSASRNFSEGVLTGGDEIEIDLPTICNDCEGTGAKDGITTECLNVM